MAKATNDKHIIDFLTCGHYIPRECGTIMTSISPQGHTLNTWRIKPVTYDPDGYARVKWKGKSMFVHRIVYQWFKGDLQSDMQVNHIDGNPRNNAIANLEQLWPCHNLEHSYRVLGRVINKGNAKIKFEVAEEVRRMHSEGASYSEINEHFGLPKATISYIVNNKIWVRK